MTPVNRDIVIPVDKAVEEQVPQRRFRPYSYYRDSGIEWLGKVPREWAAKRLRFVARINPVKSELRGLLPEDDVSFVPMESVCEHGGLVLDQTKPLESVYQGYTYFRDGDIVVAKITPCFENGKGSIAANLTNRVAFGTTELHVLRAQAELDASFLFYLTISHGFRRLGTGEMYGAGGQKRVPEDFLRDFRTPLPPLDEQQAIAAFLDRETGRIDELIAKKQRLIELLAEKRTALISHAVTKGLNPDAPIEDSGINWFGDIPSGWTIHQLRRVVRRFVDYRGRTPTKTDSGIPLITAGAVRDGGIDHSRVPEYIAEDDYQDWMCRGWPEEDDVVITTEAPLAEVALVNDVDVAFAQRIIIFKLNRFRVHPEWMRYYYLSPAGRSELLSRASGSTATGIRADRLRMSLVLVPPLEEQRSIIEYLNPRVAELIAPIDSIQSAIAALREYRSALISAAVTGKIDVRERMKAEG